MRTKTGLNNIKKDIVKRKRFLKQEIKTLIMKSVINNKHAQPIIRANMLYNISQFSHKKSISKQNNNICLKTGRIGGVYNTFNYSRHYLKKLGINNNLQNYKITGW